jgi:hypothetical protein
MIKRENEVIMSEIVEKKQKQKSGAQSRLNEEMIERAEKLSGCMMLDYQIAEGLDISLETFYKYRRESLPFSEALLKGRAQTLERVTQSAIYRAETDPQMAMFFLKNKGGWIEKNQQLKIDIQQKELELKEKAFKLQSEKFISELCEKHNLSKEETLATLDKHLNSKI